MKRHFEWKLEPRAAVYAITFIPTGAQYVGSTNNLKRRVARHLSDLGCGRHANRFLQRAWRKYGAERFDWSVLEWVPEVSALSQREQHYLDTLRPRFNFARSATHPMLGRTHTAEARRKIAAAAKRNWRPFPPRPLTAEQRARLSALAKAAGRRPPGQPRGSHPSAETRARMSAARRGKQPPNTRLTWPGVRAIRGRYAEGGVTLEQLGSAYGVHLATIWLIISGKTWKEPAPAVGDRP